MTLKGKFIFLVAGVGLLPLLAAAMALSLRMADPTGVPSFERTLETLKILQERLEPALESGDFSPLVRLPETMGLAVVQSSTGDLLFAGGVLVGLEASQLSELPRSGKDLQILNFLKGEQTVQVYISSEHRVYELNRSNRYIYLLPIILLLSLFLFTTVMALFILRGINRSIIKLEAGTRRIAGGDLGSGLIMDKRDDLGSLALCFEEMRLRLKEEYERRDRFIMGVSHDLKTPLSVIDGYLEALQDGFGSTPEEVQKYVGIMKDKARLLGERIVHLIELARMTTQDWRKTLEPTNLKSYLTSALEVFKDEISIQDFHLVMELNISEKLVVSMNRDLFQRALENLVQNAVSYSGSHRDIFFSAREISGEIQIGVENNGPGIRVENRDRVFEPFFRESSSRRDGGFGLGLASVKSIIETHGWTISLESTPGDRTRFTIHILHYTQLPPG